MTGHSLEVLQRALKIADLIQIYLGKPVGASRSRHARGISRVDVLVGSNGMRHLARIV